VFGLPEHRDGILASHSHSLSSSEKGSGVVVEMEIRRKSGRGITEIFVLISPASLATRTSIDPTNANSAKIQLSTLVLLDEHPGYRTMLPAPQALGGGEGGEVESTFNLNLSEKQRRDRDEVVLPYFDAQKEGGLGEGGAGEGGRILYEMGREDWGDFDEEEDEV